MVQSTTTSSACMHCNGQNQGPANSCCKGVLAWVTNCGATSAQCNPMKALTANSTSNIGARSGRTKKPSTAVTGRIDRRITGQRPQLDPTPERSPQTDMRGCIARRPGNAAR